MMKNYDQSVEINYNTNWPYMTILIGSSLLLA